MIQFLEGFLGGLVGGAVAFVAIIFYYIRKVNEK